MDAQESANELASDDFLVSYPIFESLLGKHTIVGREAVKEFNAGFCQRWADPEVTIHEVIAKPLDGEHEPNGIRRLES